MAQETKVEETLCSLQAFERNRYFYGKPMTVSDFEAEQRYLIGKQRSVNRLVHGAGVLCGLQVTLPTGFSADRPTVEVAEGAALDCCGNLIVVSRSSTVEIKGDFDPQKPNYLFIKYTECSKQPVMLSANGSSCEEVCCYNRIQETFEIWASTTAPGSGTAAAAATPKPPAAGTTTTDAEEVCRALTEKYYQENLKTCPGCDDPLVFLAVLDAGKVEIDEDETARYRSVVFNNSMLHELLCEHVTDYNNPHHTTAEQVRALQSVNGVGNNSTRSFVANIDLRSNDNTVTVTPNKNTNKIDLVLGPSAVMVKHLNEDLINHLILPSDTVNVVPNVSAKSVTLSTKPAKSVTSVGKSQAVGTANSFAPEDHAHDLSADVVGLKHLGAEVFEKLVGGGGIVKVVGDAKSRTINVSADVAPGDEVKLVSSVTGKKRPGTSSRYAREDHAHDLFINGRSPNVGGAFVLTPGPNVRIDNGAADNELVISAEGGSKTVGATGVWVFENVLPQEMRRSDVFFHGLESGMVAVVLAEEVQGSLREVSGVTRPTVVNTSAIFGDITAFSDEAPFLMAQADYFAKAIQISLKDRRPPRDGGTAFQPQGESSLKLAPAEEATPTPEAAPPPETETAGFVAPSGGEDGGIIVSNPDARTYRVRWWAIPA
jgi:hypothetical protein